MGIRKLLVLLVAAGTMALATVGIAAAAPSGQDANSDNDATAQHRLEREDKAYLGLPTKPLTDRVRKALGLPEDLSGAVAQRTVSDGPADVAGMLRGDVVIQAQGQAVVSPHGLNAIVHEMEPGDVITLQYVRDGARVEVDIELTSPPERGDRGNRGAPPWLTHLHKYLSAFPNTVEASLTVMSADEEVHVWEITQGNVFETSETGLKVEMKTGETVAFVLVEGSVALQSRQLVEPSNLEEGAHVLVLEIDGDVKAVVADPLKHQRDVKPNNQRRHVIDRFLSELRQLPEGSTGSDAPGRARTPNEAREQGGHIQERVERSQQRLHEPQEPA